MKLWQGVFWGMCVEEPAGGPWIQDTKHLFPLCEPGLLLALKFTLSFLVCLWLKFNVKLLLS